MKIYVKLLKSYLFLIISYMAAEKPNFGEQAKEAKADHKLSEAEVANMLTEEQIAELQKKGSEARKAFLKLSETERKEFQEELGMKGAEVDGDFGPNTLDHMFMRAGMHDKVVLEKNKNNMNKDWRKASLNKTIEPTKWSHTESKNEGSLDYFTNVTSPFEFGANDPKYPEFASFSKLGIKDITLIQGRGPNALPIACFTCSLKNASGNTERLTIWTGKNTNTQKISFSHFSVDVDHFSSGIDRGGSLAKYVQTESPKTNDTFSFNGEKFRFITKDSSQPPQFEKIKS